MEWEVVGKTKKNKQNGDTKLKISKEEKTKFLSKAPKLEELRTATDTKFAVLDTEVPKAVETKKEKVQAAPVTHSPKKSDKGKPQKPKNLGEALDQLKHSDLVQYVEDTKKSFPGKSDVLLDGLATYLNSALAFDTSDSSSSFLEKPASYLPSCLTKQTKKYLDALIHSQENRILEKYLLVWIKAMAQDMAKNRPVNGYRLLLSFLLIDKHQLDEAHLREISSMCETYKNQPKIILCIFWAICNAGRKDVKTGMNVWRLVLCNFLHFKNYSKPAVDYLVERLSTIPEDTKKSYMPEEDYFKLFDQIYPHEGKSSLLPTQTQKSLIAELPKIKSVAYGNKQENLRTFFLPYLERLNFQTPEAVRLLILDELVECLRSDSDCYKVWENQFKNYLDQSAILLNFLIEKQHLLHPHLLRSTVSRLRDECSEVVAAAQDQQSQSGRFKKQKKLPEGYANCLDAAGKLLDVSPSRPKKRKSSSLRKWNFTLLAIFAAILYYDTAIHGLGQFEDSRMGQFLQHSGLTEKWDAISNKTSQVIFETQSHLEEFYPQYYKPVHTYYVAGWNAGAMGLKIVAEYGAVAYNWLAVNIPVGIDKVESSFPGTKERVAKGYATACSSVNHYATVSYEMLLPYAKLAIAALFDLLAAAKIQSQLAVEYVTPRVVEGGEWVKKNVFGTNVSWEQLRGDLYDATLVLYGKLSASYHVVLHKFGLCSGH